MIIISNYSKAAAEFNYLFYLFTTSLYIYINTIFVLLYLKDSAWFKNIITSNVSCTVWVICKLNYGTIPLCIVTLTDGVHHVHLHKIMLLFFIPPLMAIGYSLVDASSSQTSLRCFILFNACCLDCSLLTSLLSARVSGRRKKDARRTERSIKVVQTEEREDRPTWSHVMFFFNINFMT